MTKSNKKLLKIQIEWSENNLLHDMSLEEQGEDARVFTSFAAFDDALRLGAASAPRTGGYDKTKFILDALIDEKARQYIGRFDLYHVSIPQGTRTGELSLKQHIVDQCTWVFNNKSGRMSENSIQSAKQWLEFLEAL